MFICIVFLLSSKLYFKYWFNPYFAFNILWFCVALMLSVGNKFLYKPSSISLWCVLIGVIGFDLSLFSKKITIGQSTTEITSYKLNHKAIHLLSTIVVITWIIMCIGSLNSLYSGASFAQVRSEYFTYDNSSNMYYYLRNYFSVPMGYVVITSTAMEFFAENGNKSKVLLLNTVLIIILQAITSGGRYVLLNSFYILLCSYFVLRKNKSFIKFRYKVLIILLCLILGYIMIFLTNERSTYLMAEMNLFEKVYTTIYLYFSGSVTYLGKVIENTPSIVGSTFGINLVAGFISPIFVILNFMHIINYPQVFNTIGTYACVELLIGPSSYFNAMPTAFGYFFIDGGLILTFVESWIFGYVCKRFYIRAQEGNLMYIGLFLLLFVQICNSSTRWFIYTSDFALAFIYMRFILKKRIEFSEDNF